MWRLSMDSISDKIHLVSHEKKDEGNNDDVMAPITKTGDSISELKTGRAAPSLQVLYQDA